MKEAQCLRNSAFSFCKARSKGHHIYEAGSIETQIRIVDENGGFTIIPEMHLPFLSEEQRRNVRKIEGDYLSQRRISIYIREDFIRERMLNTLVDTLKMFIPEEMMGEGIRKYGIKLYAPIPPTIDEDCFNGTSIDVSGKLYVPSSSIALYKESAWNQWAQILAIGSEEIPDVKKCKEPKLCYKNGKIQFTCETPNVKFHYRLVNNDVTDSYEMVSGSEINLDAKYELSIYATADGFLNSNTVTATLYWL